MKGKKRKLLALLLAAMLLVTSLSGCGGAPAQSPAPSRESSGEKNSSQGTRSEASEPEKESQAEETPEEETGESADLEEDEVVVPSSGASYQSTVRDRIKRLKEKRQAAQESSGSSSQSEGSSDNAASSQSSSGSSKSSASSQSSSESSKAPASSQSSSGSSKTSASSQSSSSASSKPEVEEVLQVGPNLEDIAQLIGLKADVETSRAACLVDVDEGENPYDVIWDYGDLYNAFVKEVDWDLLFDGDYYIQTFPVLAHLYHKDKALLLRHFQTVGIHEGRQGCEGFNVAAYQKNCDAKVKNAFGDNYECYYFYYAMNQKTQKGVVTTGSEKKQLTTKLTDMQETEVDNINKYRAEVGVAPLEYDAELSALACYRAYIDALEDWDAHDWLQTPENLDEAYGMVDMMMAEYWSENTVHGYNKSSKEDAIKRYCTSTAWYIKYRYSEAHYQAMIDKKYHYVGSANCYISEYKKDNPDHPEAKAVYVQFDVFVPSLITPAHS